MGSHGLPATIAAATPICLDATVEASCCSRWLLTRYLWNILQRPRIQHGHLYRGTFHIIGMVILMQPYL